MHFTGLPSLQYTRFRIFLMFTIAPWLLYTFYCSVRFPWSNLETKNVIKTVTVMEYNNRSLIQTFYTPEVKLRTYYGTAFVRPFFSHIMSARYLDKFQSDSHGTW